MSNDAWAVLPHGPLVELAENLWRAEGNLPSGPLKRVMTVARRSDGKLVVHNAIAMGDPEMKELEALGDLAWLVVPNGYHRIDAGRFAARYPEMKVHCPPGSRRRVGEAVRVDGTLDEIPADADVRFEKLHGVADAESVMVVRSKDGVTLVVNDLFFNMPHADGPVGSALKHLANSSGGPRISRISRLLLIKDKAKTRADLERLAEIPDLVRVIVSHHETITDKPAAVLRALASTL